MKGMGVWLRATGWIWVAVAGFLIPNFALAAKGGLAQEACESQAHASFKKKAVEVEMAKIVGNLSELEAVTEREGLHRHLEKEKANCLHVARSASSYAEPSGAL